MNAEAAKGIKQRELLFHAIEENLSLVTVFRIFFIKADGEEAVKTELYF